MTGNELYHSYKAKCVQKKLALKGRYITFRKQWDALADELNKNNISKSEFLDFLFEKISKPYTNILFSKVGQLFKYVELYKQFANTSVPKKVLSEETQEEIRTQIYEMRIWLSLAYVELQLRKQDILYPDIKKYSNSLALLANEYSPIYLAYLYQNSDFLHDYKSTGFNDKLFKAIQSPKLKKYFPIIEKIKQTNTSFLIVEYRKKYKKYIEKIKMIEEPFKKLTLINLGTVRYI